MTEQSQDGVTDAEIQSAIDECRGKVPFAANLMREWLRERRAAQVAVLEGCAMLYVGHGQYARCDWEDWPLVRGYWWRLTAATGRTRYAQAWDSHDTTTRSRITMHGLIMRPPGGQHVDHIDGDGLNNSRSNLRLVTVQQNAMNQHEHGGSSRFKGVSFERESGLWRSYITKDGKRTYLGRFGREIEAAKAYNAAAQENFGEYAKLNRVD